MDARFAMWVHGVSVVPERTAGDIGADGPLVQVRDSEDRGIPYTDITGLRQGSGAIFRGKRNHDNWFHFSIPTPVLVPMYQPVSSTFREKSIRLEKVFVLHRNPAVYDAALAWVADVHVWDGSENRYDTRLDPPPGSGLANDVRLIPAPTDETQDLGMLRSDRYGGNHETIQPDWNAWVLTSSGSLIKPLIRWGVCISVLVHFADEVDFRFVAAGADFVLDVP
jgi:hypothetical protein